jgi:16S rRNA (guanine(527)-N(7))-methyltransferase RsmG
LFEKIKHFKSYLFEYNESTNIYSKKSYDFLDIHIQDSLNLAELTKGSPVHVDLGSGSGLPGVIMAMSGKSEIICVESKQKKRLFLNYVKEALDLSNLTIFNGDVQLFTKVYSGPKITSLSAKAFAKPPKLLMYLSMFRKPQVLSSAHCWVPISKNQEKILKNFDEIVSMKASAGHEFLYFKIQMARFQGYKADLRNQYNL